MLRAETQSLITYPDHGLRSTQMLGEDTKRGERIIIHQVRGTFLMITRENTHDR